MKKLHSLIIGFFLLAIAILFVYYSIHHPEQAFPWNNKFTYIMYGIYVGLVFKFLIEIPLARDIRHKDKTISNSIKAIILYFALAIIFLAIALTDKTASIYTFLQGFIVFASCDLAIENLSWYLKNKQRC